MYYFRCRSFPGLVNNTTLDWVFPWPRQALEAVAKIHFLDNRQIPINFCEKIISHVVHVHESVANYTEDYRISQRRRNYVTPKHFVDFISLYISLLVEKNNFILSQVNFVNIYL